MKGGSALITGQRRDYLEQAGRKRSRQDRKLRQLWMTQPRERTETEEERQTTTKDQDGTESTGVTRVTRQKGHRPRPPNSCSLKTGSAPPHTASGKFLLMNQEPNRLQVQRRLPKDLSHEGRGRDGSLTEPGVLPKRYVPSLGRQRGPFPRGSWKCVSQCVFNSIKCTPRNRHTHSRTCRTLSLPSRSLQPSEGVTISNAKETN